MSEVQQQEDDLRVASEEPSRRTFLKVSAVAGATVAAIAAGASMIPKIAGSTSAAKSAGAKSEGEARPVSAFAAASTSAEPLIVVVRGEAVDVYRGETKFPIVDRSLARDLTSRVAAKIEAQ
jgi:hypothetical protein